MVDVMKAVISLLHSRQLSGSIGNYEVGGS